MKIQKIAEISGGQDGAIFGDYLFRFDHKGHCFVYGLQDSENIVPVSEFDLDKSDVLAPHSNVVMFGNEYYSREDEFPLLYANIYNNYAKAENPMKGATLVYRLQRAGTEFKTTLVQKIQIAFTESEAYWKSFSDKEDVRPFGNFVIDTKSGLYYAFVMRDKSKTTRYFAFDLPKPTEGTADEATGIKTVQLDICDIKEQFDCAYQNYIQGASFWDGKIYSLEGFTADSANPPCLRVVDAGKKEQLLCINFAELGYPIEPELIDFKNGVCYYGDHEGNLYIISF